MISTIRQAAVVPIGALRRRRHRRAWRPRQSAVVGLGLTAPFLITIAVLLVYPFIRLIVTALGAPKGLGNFASFFSQGSDLIVLRTTFVDSLIVTALCTIIGAIIAWSMRTTPHRLTRLVFMLAVLVPFWMGSVIKVYVFTILLETHGALNILLLHLHIISQPLSLLYTQPAVIIGMTYQMIPYAVLPLYVGALTIDTDMLLAAQSLGASRARALWSIALPLSVPALLATVTVVYVICLGFYLTPVLLGGATSPFAATLIDTDVFSFYNITEAAVTGVSLLVGALIVVWAGYAVVGKERLMRAIV